MQDYLYVVGVNYGTSNLIRNWYESVSRFHPNANFIIVDNFSTLEERERIELLAEELSMTLLKKENVGYGIAINAAIDLVKKRHNSIDNVTLMCGNLDIEFSNVPMSFPKGPYVFVPQALEGSRNRNPFLTKLQSKFLSLHKFSVKLNNLYFFIFVIFLLKIVSKIPSPIWAVHGSLFCFNLDCIGESEVFNAETFLYSEELEFASYVNNRGEVSFIESDIIYHHEAHCATKEIITNKSDFFELWKKGFSNWCVRWSI